MQFINSNHELDTFDSYATMMKHRILKFCELLIRRFPISAYCWFCGRINPFTAFPENIGLLPPQYMTGTSCGKIVSCIYLHRLNWKMKFNERNTLMPFHPHISCHCNDSCQCDLCEDEPGACPVKGSFKLWYYELNRRMSQVGLETSECSSVNVNSVN